MILLSVGGNEAFPRSLCFSGFMRRIGNKGDTDDRRQENAKRRFINPTAPIAARPRRLTPKRKRPSARAAIRFTSTSDRQQQTSLPRAALVPGSYTETAQPCLQMISICFETKTFRCQRFLCCFDRIRVRGSCYRTQDDLQ